MTMKTVAVVVFGCVAVFALRPSSLVAGYAQSDEPAIIADEWHSPRPHTDMTPCDASVSDENWSEPSALGQDITYGGFPDILASKPSESVPDLLITRFLYGLLLLEAR